MKGDGLNDPTRGLADVSISENHVCRYYCIKSFCHLKTLEKRFEKLILFITIIACKSMKDP